MIATNIPRRYASTVFRNGIESLQTLPEEARRYLPPLPITIDLEIDCYRNLLTTDMGPGHGGGINMAYAQGVKDVTMAHFIARNLRDGGLFLHANGAYHSDNRQGIAWGLRRIRPNLRIVTVTTVSQERLDSLGADGCDRADIVICVPSDMTRTHARAEEQ